MWRRVNACPKILPWIIQNQGIDAIMQNEDAQFVDIVDALINAWEIFLSFISASGEVGQELLEWIQRRTLRVVLQADWVTSPAAARLHLHQLAAQVVTILSREDRNGDESGYRSTDGDDKDVLAAFTVLRDIIDEPWTDNIRSIITGDCKQVDDTVLELCRKEWGIVLQMRVNQLIAYKCDDLALNLVEIVMKCISDDSWKNHKGFGSQNSTNYLSDVYAALLYKFKREQDIICYLKHLSSEEGLNFIERQLNKDATAKLWKSSIKIARLGAQFFLSTALIKPDSVTYPQFLDKLTALWATMSEYDPTIYTTLPDMIRKMILYVDSATNIYELSRALLQKFAGNAQVFCVELFVRALSLDLNELENAKQKRDSPAISAATTTTATSGMPALRASGDATEQHATSITPDGVATDATNPHDAAAATVAALELRLAEQLEQLATLMRSRAPTAWRECLLTAFCLCPSPARLAALVVAAGEIANRKAGIGPSDPRQNTRREGRSVQKRVQSFRGRRYSDNGWGYQDERNVSGRGCGDARNEDGDLYTGRKKTAIEEEQILNFTHTENRDKDGDSKNQYTECSIASQSLETIGSTEFERGANEYDKIGSPEARGVQKTWGEEEIGLNGTVLGVKRKLSTKEVSKEIPVQKYDFAKCEGDGSEDVNGVMEERGGVERNISGSLVRNSQKNIQIYSKKNHEIISKHRYISDRVGESFNQRGYIREEKIKWNIVENNSGGEHEDITLTPRGHVNYEDETVLQSPECYFSDDEEILSEEDNASETLSCVSDEDVTRGSLLLDDMEWKDSFRMECYENGKYTHNYSRKDNGYAGADLEPKESLTKTCYLPQYASQGSHVDEIFITRGKCEQEELPAFRDCDGPWRFKEELLLKETHQHNRSYDNSNYSYLQTSTDVLQNKIKNYSEHMYNSNVMENVNKSEYSVPFTRGEIIDKNVSPFHEEGMNATDDDCNKTKLPVLSKTPAESDEGDHFGTVMRIGKNCSINKNTKSRVEHLDQNNQEVTQGTKTYASTMEINQCAKKENNSQTLRTLLENENTRATNETPRMRSLKLYESTRNKTSEKLDEIYGENDRYSHVTCINSTRTSDSEGGIFIESSSCVKDITKTPPLKPCQCITKSITANSDTMRRELDTNLVCCSCDSLKNSDSKYMSQQSLAQNLGSTLFCDLEDHVDEEKMIAEGQTYHTFFRSGFLGPRQIETGFPPTEMTFSQDQIIGKNVSSECTDKEMGVSGCTSTDATGDIIRRRELPTEVEPDRGCGKKGVVEDALLEPQGLRAEAAALGLPAALCDDLIVLLSCHRYRALSWSLGWHDLLARCVAYMRGGHVARSRKQELRFLKPQYTQPQYRTDDHPQDGDEYCPSDHSPGGDRRSDLLGSTKSKEKHAGLLNVATTATVEKRSRRLRAKRKSYTMENFESTDDGECNEIQVVSSNVNSKSKRRREANNTWVCTQITDTTSKNGNSFKIKLEKSRSSNQTDQDYSEEIQISKEDLIKNFNFNAYVKLERIDISPYLDKNNGSVKDSEVDTTDTLKQHENEAEKDNIVDKVEENVTSVCDENKEEEEKLQESGGETESDDEGIPDTEDGTVMAKDSAIGKERNEDSQVFDLTAANSQNFDNPVNSCGLTSLSKSDDEQDTETNDLDNGPGSPDSGATLSASEDNCWTDFDMADEPLEFTQHGTKEFSSDIARSHSKPEAIGSTEHVSESSIYEDPLCYMVNSVGIEPHRESHNVWTRIEVPKLESELQPSTHADTHLQGEFVPVPDSDPTQNAFNAQPTLQDTQACLGDSEPTPVSSRTDIPGYSTLEVDGNRLRILESKGNFVTIVSVMPLEKDCARPKSSVDTSGSIPLSPNVMHSLESASKKKCDVFQNSGDKEIVVANGGNGSSNYVGTIGKEFTEFRDIENNTLLNCYNVSNSIPTNYSTVSEIYSSYVSGNNTDGSLTQPNGSYLQLLNSNDDLLNSKFTDIYNIYGVCGGNRSVSQSEDLLVRGHETNYDHAFSFLENNAPRFPTVNFDATRTSLSSSGYVNEGSFNQLDISQDNYYSKWLNNSGTQNLKQMGPAMSVRINYNDSLKPNTVIPTAMNKSFPIKKIESRIPPKHGQHLASKLAASAGSSSSMALPTKQLIRQAILPGKFCGKKLLLTKRCFPAMSGIYNINANGTVMERKVRPKSDGRVPQNPGISFCSDEVKVGNASNGFINTSSLTNCRNTTSKNSVRMIAGPKINERMLKPFSCIARPTTTTKNIYKMISGNLNRNHDVNEVNIPRTYPTHGSSHSWSHSDQFQPKKMLNPTIPSDSRVYEANEKLQETHLRPSVLSPYSSTKARHYTCTAPPTQQEIHNGEQHPRKRGISSRFVPEKILPTYESILGTESNPKKINKRNKQILPHLLTSSVKNMLVSGVPTTESVLTEKISLQDDKTSVVVQTCVSSTPKTIKCNAGRQRKQTNIKGTLKRVRMCF